MQRDLESIESMFSQGQLSPESYWDQVASKRLAGLQIPLTAKESARLLKALARMRESFQRAVAYGNAAIPAQARSQPCGGSDLAGGQ